MSKRTRYLVDTNVLSETRKRRADENVLQLLQSAGSENLFVSVITIGELHKGVALRRRIDQEGADSLDEWVSAIEASMAERILPVDAQVARIWGEISADRTRPVLDTLIAATAIAHNLTLLTRNVKDMTGLDVSIVNPWEV